MLGTVLSGCERGGGGGSKTDTPPPFEVSTQLTNSCGKAVFLTGEEEMVVLQLVNEDNEPIKGLQVTAFTDETGYTGMLLVVTDPTSNYLIYMFSPGDNESGEAEFVDCSEEPAEDQALTKHYILRKMITLASALEKGTYINPVFQEKVENFEKYLFDPHYGYYESKFTSSLTEIDAKLKDAWMESGLDDEICLISGEDSYLGAIAFYQGNSGQEINPDPEAIDYRLNIFKAVEVTQGQEYLRGGYEADQIFDVYFPRWGLWTSMPFPVIKPHQGPINNPPQLTVSAEPTEGKSPLTVQFTAEAEDTDGTVVSYEWDFGDGETSTEQNPTHVYKKGGEIYTATCRVVDDDGAMAIASVDINVIYTTTGDEGRYLVYKISPGPTSGTVEFDVTGLSAAGSSKDVLFVLGKGLTRSSYEVWRMDIRKYAGGRDLMKTVIVQQPRAIEAYWLNRSKIFWNPGHTYHFTVTWGNSVFRATREDTTTGETITFVANYASVGVFDPTYVMIGWNPKYGIPPGGYYSNVKLPQGVEYTLVMKD